MCKKKVCGNNHNHHHNHKKIVVGWLVDCNQNFQIIKHISRVCLFGYLVITVVFWNVCFAMINNNWLIIEIYASHFSLIFVCVIIIYFVAFFYNRFRALSKSWFVYKNVATFTHVHFIFDPSILMISFILCVCV